MVMQSDRDAVLYDQNNNKIWSSCSSMRGLGPYRMVWKKKMSENKK